MNAVVRQVRIVRIPIKGELKHAHPGQLKLIPQRRNRRCDESQVFGEQREPTQRLPHFVEEIRAWTGNPPPCNCRRRSSRHVPGRLEAAKVIDANRVEVIQPRLEPIDPPAIARLSERLPVIDRVPPQLALGAEIIRRNAGDDPGLRLVVQEEQLRIGPYVRRIRGNKDGKITQQPHSALIRIILEELPVPQHDELAKAELLHGIGQLSPRLGKGSPFPQRQAGRPLLKWHSPGIWLAVP